MSSVKEVRQRFVTILIEAYKVSLALLVVSQLKCIVNYK